MRTNRYQRTTINDLLFEYRGYTVNLYGTQRGAAPSTALSLSCGPTRLTCVASSIGLVPAYQLDHNASRLPMPSA